MLMCISICDDLKALILLLSLKINQEKKQQQFCGTTLSMQSSCLSLCLGHSTGFLIHPHISQALNYYCTRDSLGSRRESCGHQKFSVSTLNRFKVYLLRSDIPGISAVGGRCITAGFETVDLSGGDIPVAAEEAATFKLHWGRNSSSSKCHEDGKLEELHCEESLEYS